MLILKAQKTIILGWEIPSLELNEGELISIWVDSLEFEFVLKDYLVGIKKHPNIEIFKNLHYVGIQPIKVSLVNRLTGRTLARHIIKKELQCEESQINEILEKSQIETGWTYMSLGGNRRRILSTLIAIEKGYGVIYTTAGMDPNGAERIHQLIKDEMKTHKFAAIEINTPDIHGKRILPNADRLIKLKRPGHNTI